MLHSSVTAALKQQLAQREQQGRRRRLQPVRPESSRLLAVDGRVYRNFSSNDYLGLSHHPNVLAQLAQPQVAGARASALVTGYTTEHADLCALLQEVLDRPRVLLFSSAFAANSGTLGTLGRHYSQLYLDRLAHASLLHGVQQSAQPWRRFRHNDLELAQRWVERQQSSCLLVSESVFSMDGDHVPYKALRDLRQQCPQVDIMLDDAHGFGVNGEDGLGVAGAFSSDEVGLITLAFGKATGVAGGAVALDELSADYLVNYCPELIYSTAMPPAQAAAIRAAVTLVVSPEGRQLRTRLQDSIAQFRMRCHAVGLPLGDSEHAIQTLQVGADDAAVRLSEKLRQHGIWCSAIRPPTVPEGTARLRITLTADHLDEDIEDLVVALQRSVEELQL